MRSAKECWDLVLQVDRLVDLLMARKHVPRQEREDAKHHIFFVLFEYARRWDPARSKWTTFASWAVRSGLRSYMFASREAGPRNQYDAPWSRAQVGPWIRDDDAPTSDDAVDAHDDRALMRRLDRVLDGLPARDRDALLRHARGETLEETGKRWGVSRERIRQLEARALELVRKRMCAA